MVGAPTSALLFCFGLTSNSETIELISTILTATFIRFISLVYFYTL